MATAEEVALDRWKQAYGSYGSFSPASDDIWIPPGLELQSCDII